jgi:hypothetical protein
VEAVQYFEANGEVCPAGWKKGGLTMKDNIKDSKTYFEAVSAYNFDPRPTSRFILMDPRESVP